MSADMIMNFMKYECLGWREFKCDSLCLCPLSWHPAGSRSRLGHAAHAGSVLTVENYTKGKNVEESLEREHIPIDGLPETFLWMKVKPGSKLRNLLGLATSSFKDERVVLWTGSGSAMTKAISCAEIMKRKFKNLYQITRVCFLKSEEVWQPVTEGLEELIVEKEIPTIHILLSKDALDRNALGYQGPESTNNFRGQVNSKREKKKIPFGKGKQQMVWVKKHSAGNEEEKSTTLISPGMSERPSQSYNRKNQKRKRTSETEQSAEGVKQEIKADSKTKKDPEI